MGWYVRLCTERVVRRDLDGRNKTANTQKALGALRSRGPTALLTSFRCLRGRGSRSLPRPFSPPGRHRRPALPLVGRRDGLPAGRLRSGQEA